MPNKPFGVLLLHGFPGNNLDFETLEPGLKALDLPYRIPNLRGMGAGDPSKLKGLTWHDWLADAHAALDDLLQEVDKAIVIGYSMGGALTIMLAAESPERIDSIILAAPMVKLANPLAPQQPLSFLRPMAKVLLRKWNFGSSELDGNKRFYPWAPIDAVLSNVELTGVAQATLPRVNRPALLLQGTKDDMVTAESLTFANDCMGTPAGQKKLIRFEGITHDIFFDPGSEPVIAAVLVFIRERIGVKVI